ncbi:MAG: hypothetical protein AB7O62_26335 [Pirellulales bacterium]
MRRAMMGLMVVGLLAMLALPALAGNNRNRGLTQSGPNGMSAARANAYMYYLYKNRNRRGVSAGYGYGGGPIWNARDFGFPMPGF